MDNKKVDKAVPGDFIGIKVSGRVRPGDEVFKSHSGISTEKLIK